MQFSHRTTLALAALLACGTAGCGKEDSVTAVNESAETVARKVQATSIKPRAGQWASTMRLENMKIAGLPAEAAAAMENQRGTTQNFSSCLTQAQVDRPDASFFQNTASGCTYDRFVMADGRVDAEMTCKTGAGTTNVRIVGSYSPESYTVAVSSKGEMQPGVPMTVDMSISSRRTGDCTGTAAQ
jgi:Protein of unknown function (DUF3617)